MICPECGSSVVGEVTDEVDIGVGTQRHFVGWDCEECGFSWVPDTAEPDLIDDEPHRDEFDPGIPKPGM